MSNVPAIRPGYTFGLDRHYRADFNQNYLTISMVQHDLRAAIDDGYIGKYANTYENKLLLVTAITNYLRSLARDGLILDNFTCGIDVDEQQAWLESQGTSTVDMSEQEIKEAGTGTHVFLAVSIHPVDAIEDVDVAITL